VRNQLDHLNYAACPPFNDWLDNQHIDAQGPLTIFGFQPRPSEVLFRLSPDTYEAAFADFQADVQELLNDLVFYEFPAPIAHYYYRFQQGYENDLQRLHFLRDTWEATIDVLHAIALGECRLLGVRLSDPMAFRHILSDSVADRLLNIERAVQLAQGPGIRAAGQWHRHDDPPRRDARTEPNEECVLAQRCSIGAASSRVDSGVPRGPAERARRPARAGGHPDLAVRGPGGCFDGARRGIQGSRTDAHDCAVPDQCGPGQRVHTVSASE
jgi:hypothetical protein